MFEVNKNPSTSDLHKFGLAMLFGFGVFGVIAWSIPAIKHWDSSLLAWTSTRGQHTALVFWGLGLLLLVIGFSPSTISKPIYVIWMTMANKIGLVVSTIMLSVLFFLLLPIFSLIVRMGDPLRKKFRTGKTYWEDYKDYEPTLDRMRRPF